MGKWICIRPGGELRRICILLKSEFHGHLGENGCVSFPGANSIGTDGNMDLYPSLCRLII